MGRKSETSLPLTAGTRGTAKWTVGMFYFKTCCDLQILVRSHSRSSKLVPSDGLPMVPYLRPIVTLSLKCTILRYSPLKSTVVLKYNYTMSHLEFHSWCGGVGYISLCIPHLIRGFPVPRYLGVHPQDFSCGPLITVSVCRLFFPCYKPVCCPVYVLHPATLNTSLCIWAMLTLTPLL